VLGVSVLSLFPLLFSPTVTFRSNCSIDLRLNLKKISKITVVQKSIFLHSSFSLRTPLSLSLPPPPPPPLRAGEEFPAFLVELWNWPPEMVVPRRLWRRLHHSARCVCVKFLLVEPAGRSSFIAGWILPSFLDTLSSFLDTLPSLTPFLPFPYCMTSSFLDTLPLIPFLDTLPWL
jgi:hypothetical protein